jgi:Protein of unknown function (DUF3551)
VKNRHSAVNGTKVETMTRIVLSIAAAAAALCLQVSSSQAEVYGNAPWCAVIEVGNGEVQWDCEYRSVEECVPNVLAGNRGSCNVNPYWAGSYAPEKVAPLAHPRRYVRRHKRWH